MSFKEICFYETINTEPFISILKLRTSYASKPVIIYKNNEALHMLLLYTPDFICWRYKQCLNSGIFGKKVLVYMVQCLPQPHQDLWLRLKDNIHKANYNEKATWVT